MSELCVFITAHSQLEVLFCLYVRHCIETILSGCVLCFSNGPNIKPQGCRPQQGADPFWFVASCVLWDSCSRVICRLHELPYGINAYAAAPQETIFLDPAHRLPTQTSHLPKGQEARSTVLNVLCWLLARFSPQSLWCLTYKESALREREPSEPLGGLSLTIALFHPFPAMGPGQLLCVSDSGNWY